MTDPTTLPVPPSAFDADRLYNDAQLASLASRVGESVDLHEEARQVFAPWGHLSTSQQQAWLSWASRIGNGPPDRLPERVRMWQFHRGTAGRVAARLARPASTRATQPRPKFANVARRGSAARHAPSAPNEDDPVTGRGAGENYHRSAGAEDTRT